MSDIKFIVTGDLHWTGKNPKARIDDYRDALKDKLKEIFELARQHEVEAIIIPGDLFDSVGASISIINELGRLFQQSPVPILTIHGGSTHGVYGGNPATKHRTPYGVLSTFEAVYDLTEQDYVIDGLRVIGHGYDVELTDRNIDYYLVDEGKNDRFTILVTHGMLLDRSPGFDMRHTLLSEVAGHQNAPSVSINGHYHPGIDCARISDTWFINPGSIGRKEASMGNLERRPKVVLLELREDNEFYPTNIYLKSAKPGHEVLSREHIEQEKKRRSITDDFMKLLAEEGESTYQDLEQIMTGIAERESLPPHIAKEGLRRLEDAREEGHNERRTG